MNEPPFKLLISYKKRVLVIWPLLAPPNTITLLIISHLLKNVNSYNMWYNRTMVDKLKLTNRLMNVRDKSKVFHSSGYARSQSGASFGVASSESFAERRTVDENRKFVQKYNNSRITNRAYGVERARTYIPRTGTTSGSANSLGANRGIGTSSVARTSRLGGAPATPATPPTRRSAPIRLK